jgi:hypothetical protein
MSQGDVNRIARALLVQKTQFSALSARRCKLRFSAWGLIEVSSTLHFGSYDQSIPFLLESVFPSAFGYLGIVYVSPPALLHLSSRDAVQTAVSKLAESLRFLQQEGTDMYCLETLLISENREVSPLS